MYISANKVKEFRELNYEKKNQNPYLLVKKLQKYSEKREVYTKELSSMINYNKFTQFDEVYYERPKQKEIKKELLLSEEETIFTLSYSVFW